MYTYERTLLQPGALQIYKHGRQRMIIVFGKIKSQAKKTVMRSYKYFFVLIFLYEIFSSLAIRIFDFCFSTDSSPFIAVILIALLVTVKFVLLPVTVVIFFRTGICISDGKAVSVNDTVRFLTGNKVLKIITVNFAPILVNLSYSLLRCFKAAFNSSMLYYVIASALLITEYYTEYKFFICNYNLARLSSGTKEIITFSLGTMKHKLSDYIKYELSFILWYLIILIVEFIGLYFLNLINIDAMQLRFITSSAFGVMFFFLPYKLFSNLLYAEYLTNNTNNELIH